MTCVPNALLQLPLGELTVSQCELLGQETSHVRHHPKRSELDPGGEKGRRGSQLAREGDDAEECQGDGGDDCHRSNPAEHEGRGENQEQDGGEERRIERAGPIDEQQGEDRCDDDHRQSPVREREALRPEVKEEEIDGGRNQCEPDKQWAVADSSQRKSVREYEQRHHPVN